MSNRKHSHLPTLGPIFLFPFRWLTLRRLFRIGKWAAVICIILGVLLALLHLVENVRGKKEWERVKAETEAKGINLNWTDYIPEPIPDETNFVAAPVMAYFQYKPDHSQHHPWQEEWGDEADFKELLKRGEGGVRGTATLILEGEQAWHESRFEQSERRRERLREEGQPIIPGGVDPWEQLDDQIEPHRQLLADLRKAAQSRPGSYIHGNYAGDRFEAPIPSFGSVRSLTYLLFADALLAMRANDTETALQNAHCLQRLGNLNPGMYFLVNAMIDVVVSKDFELPIYQLALREGVLDDAQLRYLMDESLEAHALADFEWSIHHEVAGGAEAIISAFDAEMFLFQPLYPSWWDRLTEFGWKTLFNNMPEGWVYIMASRQVHYTTLILEPYDVARRRFYPEVMTEVREAIEEMYMEADFFDSLAGLAIPAFKKVTETTLTLQCQQDMLGIACALELYRRANGDLPTSLNELSPEFIVKLHDDPVSGEAYRYERVDEKSYRLWAVGMDGLDDGGLYDPESRNSDQADIIWPLIL